MHASVCDPVCVCVRACVSLSVSVCLSVSYLLSTTLSRALPTSLPGTVSAISSTQVTCRAWAAGLGNSLNLQSQLGKGPGDLPAIGGAVVKEGQAEGGPTLHYNLGLV